ncbi:hypothetical protein N7530_011401 [Penicillium desertorum]|uniref:Uncharacterized protein n=1 Tax=Penicillium desertorum TaxID=1303715 RepID=A0A9X0BHI4_9EURO|nr:hypothetical protein N7530_011401 [Penicillium desertorum]
MRSMLKSKSAVYAGDGAMDLKEVGDAPNQGYSGASKELQPEDRVSQISFQLIRSLGSQWHPRLDQRVVESRTEGGVIPRE